MTASWRSTPATPSPGHRATATSCGSSTTAVQMKVRARLTESMKPGVVNCYQGGWDTIRVKHYIEGHPNNLTHQIAKARPVAHPELPIERGVLRRPRPSRAIRSVIDMAAKKTYVPHHVMVIDTNRCVGCWTCAVACKEINNEPLGYWWNRILTTAPNQSTTREGSRERQHRRALGHLPEPRARLPARRLPALQRRPVREGLPGAGDLPPRRRHRARRLQPLHRLPLLHGGLPVRGAHLQLGRLPPTPRAASSATASSTGPETASCSRPSVRRASSRSAPSASSASTSASCRSASRLPARRAGLR